MIDIYLDGKEIFCRDDFYKRMSAELAILSETSLGKECRIGESLDAIYDVLTDAREAVSVHIVNPKYMFANERTYYDRFMRMMRAATLENKMLKVEVCEDNKVMTTEKGYAKINLSLDVTGRLDNGYHLVKMVMASVSVYDELIFAKSSVAGIRLAMASSEETTNKHVGVAPLSMGEDNLIIKAARLILDANRLKEIGIDAEVLAKKGISPDVVGLDITLKKNIPMAAGMAGGSADAAATLRAINRLYELDFSNEELCKMGVKLGADVPFCVLQGCYLSEGIGEVLTKLPSLNEVFGGNAYIALIKPPIDVSTKFVYEHLDTDGVKVHPDVDGQISAIEAGNLKGMTACMRNVLRDVTVPAYPIVLELEEFLKNRGALNAMMSGSGPTVFGIFDDEKKCIDAIKMAQEQYPEMYASVAAFA